MSNITQTLWVASMMLEWLGKFKRPFTLVGMGLIAEMCTSIVLKSYPRLPEGVSTHTMVNLLVSST